jgi:tRNA dimethylallyltransferase
MIDNLIFRSSAVGGLCGKTGLGATGEKLAIKTYLQKRYGRYKEITNKYLEKGIDYLKGQLQQVDPNYFQIVDQQNPVRLIRAISIFRETGLPFSTFRTGNKVDRFFESHCFYLSPPRAILYERINDRVDIMVNDGLIDEVRSLQEFKGLKALQTVGYTELFKYYSNEYEIKEAILKIKQHTRQYAKRQLTWFNNAEKWTKWEDENTILF